MKLERSNVLLSPLSINLNKNVHTYKYKYKYMHIYNTGRNESSKICNLKFHDYTIFR